MIWKGKHLNKYSEIIDFALDLEGDEQRAFVKEYAATSKNALSNVGYFSGYYGPKKAREILKVFGTVHPIFGLGTPTPETALNAGKLMAKQYLKKKKQREGE